MTVAVSDGSVGVVDVRAPSYCPLHQTEDTCHATALEEKWQRLKAAHIARCTRTDCKVSDQYVTITHGNTGVTADVWFWWREMRWI